MKNLGRNRIASLVSLLLAALWLFAADAHAASPGAAQVKKVVGSVTYTDAKGGGPLTEGQILFQGTTITTGAGSYADLNLGVNGDSLRVEADSTLALNKLEYTRAGEIVVNTQMDVQKGAVVANVINKLSKASKYEIKTPAGVAGIRGTALRAGAAGVFTLSGKVEFRLNNGTLQLVIGGTVYVPGAAGVTKATAVQTSGLAQAATSCTANTQSSAATVANVVQQFTAAIAAEAASEAGKSGGDVAQAAATAAKAIMAQLVAAVQTAANEAPSAIRGAAQAAAVNLVTKSEAVQATAAASAAGAAIVANGGTVQQAKTAAQTAAVESTKTATNPNGNTAVATVAAANVTTGSLQTAVINRNAGGANGTTASIIDSVVEAAKPATPGPGFGNTKVGKGKVNTTVGETATFVSPGAAGGTTTDPIQKK